MFKYLFGAEIPLPLRFIIDFFSLLGLVWVRMIEIREQQERPCNDPLRGYRRGGSEEPWSPDLSLVPPIYANSKPVRRQARER
jgi:hypothetical protein